MSKNKFPEFNEEKAKKAFEIAIKEHKNHAKEYNPDTILKRSKTLEDVLKRSEKRLKENPDSLF